MLSPSHQKPWILSNSFRNDSFLTFGILKPLLWMNSLKATVPWRSPSNFSWKQFRTRKGQLSEAQFHTYQVFFQKAFVLIKYLILWGFCLLGAHTWLCLGLTGFGEPYEVLGSNLVQQCARHIPYPLYYYSSFKQILGFSPTLQPREKIRTRDWIIGSQLVNQSCLFLLYETST